MLSSYNKKHIIISIILVVVYLVGIVGHLTPQFRGLFLALTPYSLLLTFLVFIYLNQLFNLKKLLVILGLILFSLGVEMIGVNTGVLFGTYAYGDTLGIKWFGVPIIIGFNWMLLNLSAYGLIKNINLNFILKALLAAVLIVFLDVLIEPIAIKLDYWHWANNSIPIKNYVTWFVVSFFIQWIIIKFKINVKFYIAFIILLTQFLFFGLLNLLL